MVDIKTRQSNKGTIRTIDRASAMTSHVKDVHASTKEVMLHSREQSRAESRRLPRLPIRWEEVRNAA